MGESRRFEVYADGIDEGLQGIGSDPWGTTNFVGLRVPTLATPDDAHRYLFNLCGFELGEGARAEILGWRQLVTIGCVALGGETSPNAQIEMEVMNPAFRFPDGNVSFHLQWLPLLTQGLLGAQPIAPIQPGIENFAFRFAQSSALLYETATVAGDGFYVDLTSYTPPFKGRPPGKPIAHMKVMHDRRSTWNTPNAWRALGLEVQGPGYFYLAASVAQTDGTADLSNFAGSLAGVQGPALAEYQFQSLFKKTTVSQTGVIYWRVGGALDVRILDKPVMTKHDVSLPPSAGVL